MSRRSDPGDTIGAAGQYRLQRSLWRDDLGTVWSAEDRAFARTVTIRVLDPDLVAESSVRTEVRTTLQEAFFRLRHPNILATLTHLVSEDESFVVMESFEGFPLSEWMSIDFQIGSEALIVVVAQMADALAHAHKIGLVHGCLSPSSIVVTPEGAKVLDFGLLPLTSAAGASPTPADDVASLARIARDARFHGTGRAEMAGEMWALLVRAIDTDPSRQPSASAIASVAARFAMVDGTEEPGSPSSLLETPVTNYRLTSPATPRVDLPHFESLERREDNPADHVSDGHPRRVRRAVAVAIVSIAALLIASSAVVFGNSASRPPPPTRTPRVSAPVDVTGVTVPNILGLPIETAMDRLAKAHLQVSTFVYVRGAKGTVVRTDPTPGEAVRAGTSVTIFVGRGSSTAG